MHKKNLKSLLVASIMSSGLITPDILAADLVPTTTTYIINDNATTSNMNVGYNNGYVGSWINPTPFNSLQFSAPGKSLNIDAGGYIANLDLHGNAPGVITISTDVNISSVLDSIANNKTDIIINDGHEVSMGETSAINNLQIGSVLGGSSFFTASTGVTFDTKFTSVGTENIFGYGGASCTFNGDIGGVGNSFSLVRIGAYPATFNGNVHADTVSILGNNSGIILGDGANVNGDIVNNTGISGNGTNLVIKGSSIIQGNIGANKIHIDNITLDSGSDLKVVGSVFVNSIPVNDNNNASLTLEHNDSLTLTANVGTINNGFTLGVDAHGNLLEYLNIGDAGGADYIISGDVVSTHNLRFVNAANKNTNLILGAASGDLQYIAGDLTSENGSKGLVNIAGNVVLGGSIGPSALNKPYKILLNSPDKSLTISGNAIYSENITFESSGTRINFASTNNVNINISSPITVDHNGYGVIKTSYTGFYYNGSMFMPIAEGRFENTITFGAGSTIGALNGNALGLIDVQDGTISFGDDANVSMINASVVNVGAGKTLKTDSISHRNEGDISDGELNVNVSGTLNATTIDGNLNTLGAASGTITSIKGNLSVGPSVADALIATNVTGKLVFTSDGYFSLADGGTLHEVTANTNNTGNLKVLGNAMLDNNLEKIKTLNISGDSGKVVDFMGSRISGNVTHGAARLSLNDNTIISGSYTANGSSISLDNNSVPNTLIATGAVTLSGDITIDALYNGGNDYYIADFSAAGSNYAALASLTINLDMQNSISEDQEVELIKVVPGTAIAFNDKITVNDPLPIFFWTKSTTKAGVFSVMKQPENFGANFEEAYIASRKILKSLTNGNATPEFEIQAARILASDPASFQELVSRIEASVTNSVSSTFSGGATSQISQIPQFSIGSVSTTTSARLDNIGVAAGSSMNTFGAWASMQGSNSRQTSYKGSSGFRSNGFGAVIGGDTKLDDNSIIGFAVGNNASNVKHKDTLLGDKTRVSSWLFGLYGQHQINDNWFVRGVGIVSQANIDNKSRRVADIGNVYGIARAKYDVVSLGVDASLGYIMPFANNSSITPTVGAKFYYTNAIDYVETGNTIQNNKVHQEAMSTMALNAGVTLATNFELENGTNLSPSLSFSGEYGLGSKTPKGTFINQGTPSITNTYVGTKPGRVKGSFGGGIQAMHDSVEYGINYNARLAPKYISHEGSVKFRVLF